MLQAEYDIPIEVNEDVIRSIRRFAAPGARASFARWLARSSRFLPRIRTVLREQGLPADLVYLAMVESGFSTHARSRARAVGTWQLISSTARRYGLRQDAWVDERRDPEKAAFAAARFLRDLHELIGDWQLTFAAYNAGPASILRGMKRGYATFWDMAREPGVLPRETRAYVPTVLAAAIIARHPEAFGFAVADLESREWSDDVVVTIPRATSLSALARAAGVGVEVVRDMNPELVAGSTPPRAYALRIPRTKSATFAARWPAVARQEARRMAARHRVSPGNSLGSVSSTLGPTVQELAGWNGTPVPAMDKPRPGCFLRVRPPGDGLDPAWAGREAE
jgi:membrane-bound lytic murein transglycosylase D